jgi:hypothetical protein
MAQYNQIEFYIERMQPDWLPSPWLIWLYRIVIGLIGGLIGLTTWLGGGLIFWRGSGPLVGLSLVLFFGLIISDHAEIKPAETIVWSWKNMRQRSTVWFIGVVLLGLIFGSIGGLRYGVIDGLLIGLFISLQGMLFSILNKGLLDGFTSGLLDKRHLFLPNQGIRRSARNSILVGLVCMFIGSLTVGLFVWVIGELIPRLSFIVQSDGVSIGLNTVLSDGVSIGLLLGLIGGLTKGGNACIKHTVLRLLLWCARCTPQPWHYVVFLDDMHSCHLLRKVGGGYLFQHYLLLDYFASLASTPTFAPGSSSNDTNSGIQRH